MRGEPISNLKLIAFINRNYIRTPAGGYAFQNGPQTVHVNLDATPYIGLVHKDEAQQFSPLDQTGAALEPRRAYLSIDGELILDCPPGPALLSDQALNAALNHLCDAEGKPLPDSELEKALEQPLEGQLWLSTDETRIEVRALPRDKSLEAYFGFIAKPRPS